MGDSQHIRIATFNVNGLRSLVGFSGGLRALLESLNYDILCVQETKMCREEVTEELSRCPGWDSYFSCCRTKRNYSGVATFCRTAFTPVRAEEGATGALSDELLKRWGVGGATGVPGGGDVRAEAPLGPGLIGGAEEMQAGADGKELLELDSEGRCVITDHRSFVLFNVYGPAVTAEEPGQHAARLDFKRRFYARLEERAESLRRAGRHVIMVGDLNALPERQDTAFWQEEEVEVMDIPAGGSEGEGGAYGGLKWSRRTWIRSLLRGYGGPYLDVFRMFHPNRPSAFTCWNVKTGARANNHGVRLDYILSAGPLLDDVSQPPTYADPMDDHGIGSDPPSRVDPTDALWIASDIRPEVQGSDHCPVEATLALPYPLPPPPTRPPLLSTKYLFQGKQLSLRDMLGGGGAGPGPSSFPGLTGANGAAAAAGGRAAEGASLATAYPSGPSQLDDAEGGPAKRRRVGPGDAEEEGGARAGGSPGPGPSSAATAARSNVSGPGPGVARPQASPSGSRPPPAGGSGRGGASGRGAGGRGNGVAAGQLSLMSFGVSMGQTQKKPPPDAGGGAATAPVAVDTYAMLGQGPPAAAVAAPVGVAGGGSNSAPGLSQEQQQEKNKQDADFWKGHLAGTAPAPRCRCNLVCAMKKSLKKNDNFGRFFYMCPKGAGPKGDPNSNCGFFKWVGAPQPPGKGDGKKTKK